MRKVLFVLAGLLVVQVALALGLNVQGVGLAGHAPGSPLLSFAASDVHRLTIEDKDGKQVVLARADEGWVLPDRGDFPADGEKLEELLADLEAAELGLPVATSEGALQRFRVSEDSFDRRLAFESEEGVLGILYLGTAQGTREVHVRRDDQSDVRRIAFSSWRAPAGRDNWVDRTMLQVEPEQIQAVAWNGRRIERIEVEVDEAGADDAADQPEEQVWRLVIPQERDVEPEAGKTLAERLARLRFTGLLPEEERASYEEETPALQFELALKDGETRTYRLLRGPEETKFAVAVEGYEPLLKISSTTGKDLIEAAEDPAFNLPTEGQPTADSDGSADEVPKG